MARYITKSVLVGFDPLGGTQIFGADTLYEPEPEAIKPTGLLDASGRPLYRVPDRRQPIGFHLAKTTA